jgi:hypothetical protein
MPNSIKTTRMAFIVAAGLDFAAAALLLFIFFAGAALVGWGTERSSLLGNALLGATGLLLAAVFAAFAVADLVVAAGIAKGRPWGRIAGIALSVLFLFVIPVGTIVGGVALSGLLGRDARDWFIGGTPVRRAPQAPSASV